MIATGRPLPCPPSSRRRSGGSLPALAGLSCFLFLASLATSFVLKVSRAPVGLSAMVALPAEADARLSDFRTAVHGVRFGSLGHERSLHASLSSPGELPSSLKSYLIAGGLEAVQALAGARAQSPLAVGGSLAPLIDPAADRSTPGLFSSMHCAESVECDELPPRGKALQKYLGNDTVNPDSMVRVAPYALRL